MTNAPYHHSPDAASNLMHNLAAKIGDLAESLTGSGPTSRTRDELRFRTRGSLSVAIAGQKGGSWFDHEAGVGGDALGLVAHLRRCTMREAAFWARAWLGNDRPAAPRMPTPIQRPATPVASATIDLARSQWREATCAADTLVSVYLASRGLTLPPDAPIKFHQRAWRNAKYGPSGPAMLALMTDPTSAAPCGVHVTYLRPGGSGKAEGDRQKIMLGNNGVIRLVPDEEVTLGLGLGEGIETSLSIMQWFQWSPVWAATSAGGIARFPVLAGIEGLTIFTDMDDRGAGLGAAMACADRWRPAGREVAICAAPPGKDFNDAITKRAA